jgi:anti-sigma factor RsiW
MRNIHLHTAPDALPEDAETREARHELLASLLAAYADGELPPETASQIDAHAAGCVRCRRALDVHRALRDRLGREPVPAATASLRERIATGVRLAGVSGSARMLASGFATSPANDSGALVHRLRATGAWRMAVAGLLLVATILATVQATVAWRASARTGSGAQEASPYSVTPQSVPLFALVLSDYRRVTASDLPGRARDLGAVRAAVPFAVTPLSHPELRLLATWTTTLAGEPAAVLAYRWNDRVVLQYLVTEGLLFQSADVRSALAQRRDLDARDGAQSLLLWAQPESGSVLVGDLGPGELAALHPRAAGP